MKNKDIKFSFFHRRCPKCNSKMDKAKNPEDYFGNPKTVWICRDCKSFITIYKSV